MENFGLFSIFGLLFYSVRSTLTVNGLVGTEFAYSRNDNQALLNITYQKCQGCSKVWQSLDPGNYIGGKLQPSINGVLIYVSSDNGTTHNGCEFPYENAKLIPRSAWIALVHQGKCSFDMKLINAFKMNASALVLIENDEKPNMEDYTKANQFQIHQTGVLISEASGEFMVSLIQNGSQIRMSIRHAAFVPNGYSNINRTSVLFVSVSFIVLMIISLAWLIFYYVQRFRYVHAKERVTKRLLSAAKKALAKIPERNLKTGDQELSGDGECCAVCIEPYNISDVVRILPCKHEFHKSCVDPWLLEHRTCPMCKMNIIKYYGLELSWSQESILQVEVNEFSGDSFGDSDQIPYNLEPRLHQMQPIAPVVMLPPENIEQTTSRSPVAESSSSDKDDKASTASAHVTDQQVDPSTTESA